MSYPSRPQYTPPYGQQGAPQDSKNMWLIGSAVIAVLVVVMTTTLFIIQRAQGSTVGSGDDDPTRAEETTEVEPANFTEEACGTYDYTSFEEVFGEPRDPEQDVTSAYSSGGTGDLQCSFYTEELHYGSFRVQAYADKAEADAKLEDDKAFWADPELGYEITDCDEIGDKGYSRSDEGTGYRENTLQVVSGKLEVEVGMFYYTDEAKADAVDAYLADIVEQSIAKFADYI